MKGFTEMMYDGVYNGRNSKNRCIGHAIGPANADGRLPRCQNFEQGLSKRCAIHLAEYQEKRRKAYGIKTVEYREH